MAAVACAQRPVCTRTQNATKTIVKTMKSESISCMRTHSRFCRSQAKQRNSTPPWDHSWRYALWVEPDLRYASTPKRRARPASAFLKYFR